MNETEWDDFITCPKCGEPDHEYTGYSPKLGHDGAEADHNCSECNHDFKVRLSVSYSYQGFDDEAVEKLMEESDG